MENIIISNQNKFEKLKEIFLAGGADKIHLVSDFNRTLTHAYVNGEKTPSLISVLRDENYLTPDYPARAHALFDKYHPIEIDPNISFEEKKKAMYEWWTTHFNLLIESGLNKKDVEEAMRSARIKFRNGVIELFDFLKEKNVPIVILSANGLGEESIELCLKRENIFFQNIHIISNAFVWDDGGQAMAVREPIVHSLNKSESSVAGYPEFKFIKERKNIILLGDNEEDVKMADGAEVENLLKIGFLSEENEERLKKFKEVYDIVILADSDMMFVCEVLKEIIKNKL